MDKTLLIKLLESVADGKTPTHDAAGKLQHMAFEDINYAHVDHHRSLRKGFPEVIFGEGKTAEQIIGIMEKMTAQDMLDLGLINGVVPHGKLIAHAKEKALALIPPKGAWLAVRMVKRAMNKPLIEEITASLDLENEALNKTFNSSDFKEAVTSRVERRTPVYRGN